MSINSAIGESIDLINSAVLRKKIQSILKQNIPNDLSSDDSRFEAMTGWNTAKLRAEWAAHRNTTSCNSFNAWVAQQSGARPGGYLARGFLDISMCEQEVPGSWIWANSSEAIDTNQHPLPGDFYASPTAIQKFAHVGVVYSFDEVAQTWTLVEGGQGGPRSNMEFIRWNKDKPFHRDKINGWVDIVKYIFSNVP